MNKYKFLFFLVLSITLLQGCKKDGVSADPLSPFSFGTQGQVYFDAITQDSASRFTCGLYSNKWQRVCYDIEKNEIAWIKRDTLAVNPYNANKVFSGLDNYNFYLKDNNLFRVFPSLTSSDSCAFTGANIDGIYFEKINKLTGETIKFKKVLTGSEMLSPVSYNISNAVYDGNTHLFFSCNKNNTLYCIDTEGNIIWKTSNYSFLKFTSNLGESGIYYNNGKIIFATSDKKVICIDAISGTELWNHVFLVPQIEGGTQFLVTNKYVFAFFPPGLTTSMARLDINTGTDIKGYYTPNKPITYNDILLDDTTVVFNTAGSTFGNYNFWVESLPIEGSNNLHANILNTEASSLYPKAYNGFIYNYTASQSKVTIECLDPKNDIRVWTLSPSIFTPFANGFVPVIYNSFFRKNTLYLIANFHFERSQIVANGEYRGNHPDLYAGVGAFTEYFGNPVSLIAIDASMGLITGTKNIALSKTVKVKSISALIVGDN